MTSSRHQPIKAEEIVLERQDLDIAKACLLEALGEFDEAARLLVQAAYRNLSVYGPASAEVVLQRARDLARAPETTAIVHDALAETLSAMGRWQEALRLDSMLLLGGGATPERLIRMARSAVYANRLDEASGFIEQAASLQAELGTLRALAALVALWHGELERAVELGKDALAEAGGDVHTAVGRSMSSNEPVKLRDCAKTLFRPSAAGHRSQSGRD